MSPPRENGALSSACLEAGSFRGGLTVSRARRASHVVDKSHDFAEIVTRELF